MKAYGLCLWEGPVAAAWIDANGHMNESHYLALASHASDALLARVGAGPSYAQSGLSFYAVETHICHRAEARLGAPLAVWTAVLGVDDKRLHIWTRIFRGDVWAAGVEQMLLHVDQRAGRACPMDPEVKAALTALCQAPEGPGVETLGRAITPPFAPRG